MPVVAYVIVVSVALFCGLMGLSAVLEPVDGIPHMRLGMPAKSVPTTSEEMTARARETAVAVNAEFKRRNPPQPITAATPAAVVAAKPAQKAVADHSARKKAPVARRQDGQPDTARGYAPRTAFSFQDGLD